MLTLEESIEKSLAQSKIWSERIQQNEQELENYSLNFRFLEEELAVKCISSKMFDQAKNHFYQCGLIDELRIRKYNDLLFDYGLPNICFPILSDNEELIQRYSRLRYSAHGKMLSMNENVEAGKSAIWCNTVQCFMANDYTSVEKNLNILETKTLKTLSNKAEVLVDDYEFYKALYGKNKMKMEEIIEKLVSPKIHKKRNMNDLLRQHISFPAAGYAKLAWRSGIEVIVSSSLVPKELLPVKPLANYITTYDFLKKIA